ncbi:phosphotransferase family protein [Streptomyces sp. NRRL S-646]|uniref:phosphotransferase family protein n=1 Tax=Streptomyces sp. NRRL S-646 TaxID=1463917 RepID=UPI001F191EBB|nr:aminoglycoside phosphotransferase family protein [Streptomyces sp. NRRL S-646]
MELGGGMYNNTYRVEFAGEQPVILRVAPEPSRQSRIERELMRNEHAVQPFLAPIASLLPRILAVDFTHQIISRDWMIQSLLPGVPAPEGFKIRPRSEWGPFFAQLGAITRQLHDVRGPHFGPITGPGFSRWSDAVIAVLQHTAADLEDVGLDARDVREAVAIAEKNRPLLDEAAKPRLLTGDLFTINCLVRDGDGPLTITGVIDFDRATWGLPDADWTIFMASRRTSTERDEFWTTYGPLSTDAAAVQRRLIYRVVHLGAIRLERQRTGRVDALAESYEEMSEVLAGLR